MFHKDYDDSDSEEVVDHDGTERRGAREPRERKGGKVAREELEGK